MQGMATIAFRDSALNFRVGKILCLGHNYRAHTREMGVSEAEPPVVFLKPPTAIIGDGEAVVTPGFCRDLHHEVEMVAVVGEGGKNIPEASALLSLAGYAVGLDMTARDVQLAAKRVGNPWTVAKGFDTSAPLSLAVERVRVPDPHALDISLKVNGTLRQHANTGEMVWRLEPAIAYLSSIFTLEPGDLVFTGTPAGVGRVVPGDLLEAELEQVGTLRVRVR